MKRMSSEHDNILMTTFGLCIVLLALWIKKKKLNENKPLYWGNKYRYEYKKEKNKNTNTNNNNDNNQSKDNLQQSV